MKFLRATDHDRVYALQPAELQMLLVVLSSFPLSQRGHTLSQFADTQEITDAQKLLDEALQEQRTHRRTELEGWLKAPDRFRQHEGQLEWRIEDSRREWLLQILNDVRVGAWSELGSPGSLEDVHRQTPEGNLRHVALMDMAGMFQMALLDQDEAG